MLPKQGESEKHGEIRPKKPPDCNKIRKIDVFVLQSTQNRLTPE
jgi:hypothetical protein